MKKNYKSVLLLVSLIFLLLFYLFHSELLVKEILSYSSLFFKNVFPTSFVFLLLSYLLMENNLFFYLQKIIKQKSFYFFIISLISGYPAGIIYIKEALSKKEISNEEANNYTLFSHFPNPIFVLYHCKKLFSNTIIPIIFYGIIILSQFIVFIVVSKKTKTEIQPKKTNTSFTTSFQSSLFKTASILLIIYGTSIFFYLLSCMILKHLIVPNYLYVFINGTLDLTKGIITSSILNNIKIQGIFLYYFIVFGSIPIHLQIKSILSDTSISYHLFLKGRILSFLLCSGFWVWIID